MTYVAEKGDAILPFEVNIHDTTLTLSWFPRLGKLSPDVDKFPLNGEVLLCLQSEVAQPGAGDLRELEQQKQLVRVTYTVILQERENNSYCIYLK